jgi:hypothetical protein
MKRYSLAVEGADQGNVGGVGGYEAANEAVLQPPSKTRVFHW